MILGQILIEGIAAVTGKFLIGQGGFMPTQSSGHGTPATVQVRSRLTPHAGCHAHCFEWAWIQRYLAASTITDSGSYPEPNPYEIGDSRISKLWVQRLADRQTVFNWDRGSDVVAVDEAAQVVVDFLAAGLADHVYPG